MNGLDEKIATLAESARAVSEWAASASLRPNESKNKAIVFGSCKLILCNLKKAGMPRVELDDNISVISSDTVTILGVILDSKLTWKPRVDAIVKDCSYARALTLVLYLDRDSLEIRLEMTMK